MTGRFTTDRPPHEPHGIPATGETVTATVPNRTLGAAIGNGGGSDAANVSVTIGTGATVEAGTSADGTNAGAVTDVANKKDYKYARITIVPPTHDFTYSASGANHNVSPPSAGTKALTLSRGRSVNLGATAKSERGQLDASHGAALRYVTSDSGVATVDKTGMVTAKGAGVCTIQVIARNGLTRSVTVTVK